MPADFDPASLDGLLGVVAAAEPGKRNSLLFWAACKARGQTGCGDAWQFACELLSRAAAIAGLPTTEITHTLNSAARKHMNVDQIENTADIVAHASEFTGTPGLSAVWRGP